MSLPSSAMHPIPLSFLVILTLHVTASRSSDGCESAFDCGPLKNLSHPFSARAHCGPPEFRLACTASSAELASGSMSYRVLRVDRQSQTMSLARSDLWNQTCPSQFHNTTIGTYLSFGAGNADLTMFYRCNDSVLSVVPENRFGCDEYEIAFNDAYFLVGPVPFDPILSIVRCNESIRVPILQTITASLMRNRSRLTEALMEGFNVTYTIPCADRVCSVPGDNRNGDSTRVAKAVGLSIAGLCILVIFIGVWTYYLRQRRKRVSGLAITKDPSTPPSSKTIAVPSTNFFRSTPSGSSYAFSKSDVEKGSTYFGAQVFSYAELEEATENFDPARELGEGGFGTVYHGQLRDGRVVAVKRLYENSFKRVEQFMNEVEILTRLQHQNLVKLYGCTSKRSKELLLVYEFIPNGTVADHLHGKQSESGALSWRVRLSIAIETADALAYLHRTEIIHRDVKTNNILLDNEFRVKVADFGLSKLFPTDVSHVSTAPQGTPGYVDPEYYQCYQLTTKSDVYSFGVVLMELISSLPAVDTSRHRHDINLANMAIIKVQNHRVKELVHPSLGFDRDDNVRRMATDMAELAFRCLQPQRDLRPSMEEVVAALRAIENEDQRPEVFDIGSEDTGLLRSLPPPLSPDSADPDKCITNSDTPNSS